jgi:ribosomal protein S18 acetylase RimI-like enzyme
MMTGGDLHGIIENHPRQIANLLNSQNQLAVPYTGAAILQAQDRYIVRFDDNAAVLGAVEVKPVQWYQCEIDHLSVDPGSRRRGIGRWLLEQAEEKGRELNARIAQCTIRVGNAESEGLFKKHGYMPTVTFSNRQTGNCVTVTLTCKIFFVCKDFSWRLCGDPS